ncbi:hypothetical protein BH24ACT5_BH24ACT5_05260 [soil metagenome]
MSTDPSTTGSSSPPPGRVNPRLAVAVVIALLVLAGIIGLAAASIFGSGGDEPSGVGLGPTVNVDRPVTIPGAGAGSRPDAPNGSGSNGDNGSGDDNGAAPVDGATTTAPLITVVAVDAVSNPDADPDELPTPGSVPVEFPALVTAPGPPSTLAGVALDALSTDDVPALAGWSVEEQSADHVVLSNGALVVEMSAVTGRDADAVIADFYRSLDGQDVERTPNTRLSTPSTRFTSAAGSQFTATRTDPRGTTTLTGSVIAATDRDGNGVLLTALRDGSATPEQLAADGETLRQLLAVAPI